MVGSVAAGGCTTARRAARVTLEPDLGSSPTEKTPQRLWPAAAGPFPGRKASRRQHGRTQNRRRRRWERRGNRARQLSLRGQNELVFANLIRDRIRPQHMIRIDPFFEDFGGKRVLVVKCGKSREPVFVRDSNKEVFFMRTGAATTELVGNQLQQYIRSRFA